MSAKQRQLRYTDYLEHMTNAINLARSHVEGLNKNDFLAGKKTQQAVILNIIVIGKAATQIADEYPEFTDALQMCRGNRCEACATAWLMDTLRSILMSFGIPYSYPCQN